MTDPVPGGGFPPPPGWQPPPPPAPTYAGTPAPPPPGAAPGSAPPPPGPWVPARGMLGAAHKPGAMPLRPLGLGDMYDAAFRIIRFNPRATVGSSVLVAAVAMAVPVLITAILTATLDLSLFASDSSGTADTGSVVGIVGSLGSLGLGTVLASFGTILVTGMMAHVTAAAAVGRRLSLGEAWAATRGKRWRLVGLALLLGFAVVLLLAIYVGLWVVVVVLLHDRVLLVVLWGLVTVPTFVAGMVWFWVRVYYLAVPALMLEPVTVLGAMRRAHALTRRQFWRTLGISLLTALVVGAAAQVLALPIGVVGQVASLAAGDRWSLLILVVSQALAQVISSAFVTPFTSAVTSLQYLDQRMRKEAYDVELMQQAGVTAS